MLKLISSRLREFYLRAGPFGAIYGDTSIPGKTNENTIDTQLALFCDLFVYIYMTRYHTKQGTRMGYTDVILKWMSTISIHFGGLFCQQVPYQPSQGLCRQ